MKNSYPIDKNLALLKLKEYSFKRTIYVIKACERFMENLSKNVVTIQDKIKLKIFRFDCTNSCKKKTCFVNIDANKNLFQNVLLVYDIE